MSNSETNGQGSVTLLRCPACRQKMVVQRASGEVVVLQRALIIRGGRVFAVCSQCKAEIPVEALSYAPQNLIVLDGRSQDSPSQDLTNPGPSITISVSETGNPVSLSQRS